MDQPFQRRGNGFLLSRDLNPELIPIASCKPLGRATRKHPPAQVRKLAASLDRFGFVLPILVDPKRRVVEGWALLLAALQLGLTEIPAVIVTDLSEAELRALRLALNRLSEDSAWDDKELALEFSDILELAPQIDLQATAFEMGEIDFLLDGRGLDEEDDLPQIEPNAEAVTRPGDQWICGVHCAFCGDAREAESFLRVLGTEKAAMVFTDPPYNVPIDGHASGLGAIRHADFVAGCGELSPTEHVAFLRTSLGHAARHSVDGAIHFVCMDWGHMSEVLRVGEDIYGDEESVRVEQGQCWNGLILQV